MAQLSANGGYWKPVGTMVYRLPKFVFSKPIMPDDCLTECLGAIKLRNDGRWGWWRWRSEFFPEWREGQGVSLIQTGATCKVLEGWCPGDSENTHTAEVYEYRQTHISGGVSRYWCAQKTVILGKVINTHTGIWTWVRYQSKLNPEWQRGRGTCGSCRLAHQNLMDGWPEQLQPGERL